MPSNSTFTAENTELGGVISASVRRTGSQRWAASFLWQTLPDLVSVLQASASAQAGSVMRGSTYQVLVDSSLGHRIQWLGTRDSISLYVVPRVDLTDFLAALTAVQSETDEPIDLDGGSPLPVPQAQIPPYLQPEALNATLDAVTLRPKFRVEEPTLLRRVGACYSGHPWVASSAGSGVATYTANDTSDFLVGTSSAKMVTTTDATFPTLTASGLTAIDATDCDLRITFKYQDHAQISAIQIQVSHASSFTDRHNFQITDIGGASSPAPDGRWFTVTLPWTSGTVTGAGATRTAITALRIVVTRNTGIAATYWLGAVDFVKQNSAGRWPNGVICLGFDDNPSTQWTLALPELDKRGIVGTIFPIIDGLGSANSLTLDQLKQLHARGWEIAGHASTGARHTAGMDTLSPEDRLDELTTIKRWMIQNGFTSDTYAYPNGRRVAAAETDVAQFFNCARLALANRVSNTHPSPIMALPAVNGGSYAASLSGYVDKVKAARGILPVMYHGFTTGTATGNTATVASLVTFLDYAQSQGVPFVTLGQALRSAT